ncbi:unnamed protein product [Psylliodes chrysocephalus]|uniref:BED-type domain-containing protein n=1 Tax=Psylliodes chrysocephalus TaxID=3402493 RepID=A0A9P0D1J3_9CUCU|nr:unnamed protein product [Psylliodes chrysocephala]
MSNSKKRKSSELWNFFDPLDEVFAKCNICSTKLSYKTSISNLRRHLQSKHPTVTVPVPSMKSSVNTSNENTDVHAGPSSSTNEEKNINLKRKRNNSGQLQISSFVSRPLVLNRKECIDGKLISLFTKSFQPFRLVEETAFKDFVNGLNPNYELPIRHMISHTMIPAMFEKCKIRVRDLIKEAKKVCITTDSWTSRNNDGYTAVTAHYMDDNFVMKSVLLECSNITDHHTSENLAKELQRIVSDWGVHDKILLAVSDNAANIKNAIDTKLKWKHLGCVAHTINLIVKDGLNCDETVTTTIGKVKSIVGFFRRSTISNQKLLTSKKPSGQSYETASIVIPIVNGIFNIYVKLQVTDFMDCIKIVLKQFVSGISERLGKVEKSNTLCTSTFCDPRFKHISFRENSTLEIIKKAIIAAVAEKYTAELCESHSEANAEIRHDDAKSRDVDELSIWFAFDQAAAIIVPQGTSTSKAIIEVQRYMESGIIPRQQDPLQ